LLERYAFQIRKKLELGVKKEGRRRGAKRFRKLFHKKVYENEEGRKRRGQKMVEERGCEGGS
jgi:hypothetical protein